MANFQSLTRTLKHNLMLGIYTYRESVSLRNILTESHQLVVCDIESSCLCFRSLGDLHCRCYVVKMCEFSILKENTLTHAHIKYNACCLLACDDGKISISVIFL